MKFIELPLEVQERLKQEQKELHTHNVNKAYWIRLYNEAGTRYIECKRATIPYIGDKGGYMPFGGGSYWNIEYGKMAFCKQKHQIGNGFDWVLCMGGNFTSVNGYEIPKQVKTKKEALEVIKRIGKFKV